VRVATVALPLFEDHPSLTGDPRVDASSGGRPSLRDRAAERRVACHQVAVVRDVVAQQRGQTLDIAPPVAVQLAGDGKPIRLLSTFRVVGSEPGRGAEGGLA
jgi:hypothetical protein